MNYFAHGRPFVDDPYFLAGTALPDWLSVVDRRVRVRGKQARSFVDHLDPQVAALARGVERHHRDDAWFHTTRAFAELSLGFTSEIRDVLPADRGFRPSFLGHILVELLLDAELIAEDPPAIEAYYRAIDELDPRLIAEAAGQMAGRSVDLLAIFIPRFSSERFLCDYALDEKLCFRLNQVMRRVKLAPLPEGFADLLPAARREVKRRKHELLPSRMENPL